MKAYLRSAPIAPKKANLIAKMVRGMPVDEATHLLSRTHKKGARMIEKLLKSAVANARHNDQQSTEALVIKTIIVNQAMGYRRGIPKARGSVRPITRFLSHISVNLGIATPDTQKTSSPAAKKTAAKKPSQASKNTVKHSGSSPKKTQSTSAKSSTADSDTVDASSSASSR